MSGEIKDGYCKKMHPRYMAVDDKADVEHAIEKWRERSGGHEGGSGEARLRREDATRSGGGTREPFSRAEGRRVVHGALIDRYSQKPCHHSPPSISVKN